MNTNQINSNQARLIVFVLIICSTSFGSSISPLKCSEIFSTRPYDVIVSEWNGSKTKDLKGRLLLLFVDLQHNLNNLRDRIRLSSKERAQNSTKLLNEPEKFKALTQAQLKEQWGDESLSLAKLNSSRKYKYLGPIHNLGRKDTIKVTRTLWLKPEELQEFLTLKAVTSHHLEIFNYDLTTLEKVYNFLGLTNITERIWRNVSESGFGVATTYALDGYTKTRPDQPLTFDPDLNLFSLQLTFDVPADAIVILPNKTATLPPHVAQNPSGYGVQVKDFSLGQEHEITFINYIPKKWISTDLRQIESQVTHQTYPLMRVRDREAVLIPSLRPQGKLTLINQLEKGTTGGKWHQDENGTKWFLKKDDHHPELQTSAEIISSHIYRLLGYQTAETVKLAIDGVFYSASKDIGESQRANFLNMNDSKIRQLRIFAAFLKDWDRIGNPDNNRITSDGSLILLDFGGTLGARAQGKHKPGEIFSESVGSFEATKDFKKIYYDFVVMASPAHPWNQITRADALAAVKKLKSLKDEDIKAIVDTAYYLNEDDHEYMVETLMTRRDGLIEGLLQEFGN